MFPDSMELFQVGERAFTNRHAYEGVGIFGANGSGKSSGSGYRCRDGYVRHGYGGLVCTVKGTDTDDWIRHVTALGRADDLLILRSDSEGSSLRFNPFQYEATRADRGGGLIANVVHVLTNALAAGVGPQLAKIDPFWDRALEGLIHNSVDTLVLAGVPLTLLAISDVVQSAPHSEEEASSSRFLESSLCGRLLRQAARRGDLPPSRRKDLDRTVTYWGADFPRLNERTRSIIEFSLRTSAEGLCRSPMRELFSADTTVTPEQTFAGKIWILDLPILAFREVGRFAQLLCQVSWMHAVERRVVRPDTRPVFLWKDEAQEFLTPHDKKFAAICRDKRAAVVSLTQNLSGMYAAMPSSDPRAACESYLGCLNTKIFHFNEDPATCDFAERLFGKEEKYRSATSLSVDGRRPDQPYDAPLVRRHVELRREERPRVPGSSLRTLRRGGEENGGCVDAIVSLAGTLIRHTFVQEKRDVA